MIQLIRIVVVVAVVVALAAAVVVVVIVVVVTIVLLVIVVTKEVTNCPNWIFGVQMRWPSTSCRRDLLMRPNCSSCNPSME